MLDRTTQLPYNMGVEASWSGFLFAAAQLRLRVNRSYREGKPPRLASTTRHTVGAICIMKKRCGKCGKEKSIDEFHRDCHHKDGLDYRCKQCKLEKDRNWYKANLEKERERTRRYKKAHIDEERNRSRRWRKNNLDRAKKMNRLWREANSDKRNAYQNRRRARKLNNGGLYTIEEWNSLCAYQSHCCACCGKKKKLTVDHVLPIVMGGKDDITNIQALCKSCNSRKNAKYIDYRLGWT